MRALLIVFHEPMIEVSLKLLQRMVELLSKGDVVELLLDGAVKALTNAVGLRRVGFCP